MGGRGAVNAVTMGLSSAAFATALLFALYGFRTCRQARDCARHAEAVLKEARSLTAKIERWNSQREQARWS